MRGDQRFRELQVCAVAAFSMTEATKGLRALGPEVGLDTVKIHSNSGNF